MDLKKLHEYLAPWRKANRGLIVTDNPGEVPEDFDAEVTNQPSGQHHWVLVTTNAIQPSMGTVADLGYLIVCRPYPGNLPSEIAAQVKDHWGGAGWLVAEEIKDGVSLVVVRLGAPANKVFYLDNRSEIGDTLSLVPLIKALQSEHRCLVVVRDDPHGLLKSYGVEVSPYVPTNCSGVWHQVPARHEYGDYYRRVDDFYHYPLHMAQLLGWLRADYPKQPEIPQVSEPLDQLESKLPKDYIVVAPEANFGPRTWPKERWSRVVYWLLEHGQSVVVLGRNGLKVRPGAYYKRYIDLNGKTTIKQAGEIIRRARLLVGCDSSPAHMAAGHGVRSIVVQGPTAGASTFRYDLQRSVHRLDDDCINCYQKAPGTPYREGEQPPLYACGNMQMPPCIDKISVGQVVSAIAEELDFQFVQKPGLSICIMVKNEAKLIGPCLDSAVKAADEVVLVDTGSKDDTIKIAQSYDGKVKVYENTTVGFENGVISDFAAARNFAFRKANHKYVMWLDAGDRIADPEVLREEVLAEKSDVLFMDTVFGETRFMRERVGPRGMVRFEYRVHETMNIDGLSTTKSKTQIDHVGSKKVGREQSLDRNIRLLRRMLKEKPNDPSRWRWHYYLARDLKNNGDHEECLKHFKASRDGQGFWEERAHSAIEVAKTYTKTKKYMEAIHAGIDALKICDGWRDPYYVIGDAYFWAGDYKKAIPWYMHCLGVPRPETSLWCWEDLYTWLPLCQLSYSYERIGDIGEALYWVTEEQQCAPQHQQERIAKRIEELKCR